MAAIYLQALIVSSTGFFIFIFFAPLFISQVRQKQRVLKLTITITGSPEAFASVFTSPPYAQLPARRTASNGTHIC